MNLLKLVLKGRFLHVACLFQEFGNSITPGGECEFLEVIGQLRRAQAEFLQDCLDIRQEYLACGETQSDLDYYKEAIPFRLK